MWKRSRFRFRTKYKQTLRLIISFTGLRGKKEVKKIVDVHSDEEDDEEEEEDEDDMESDADKNGEDDMEEVRYPRWKRFSTVTVRSHVPVFAPLDFLMHFNIMCEQYHRNLFNPFLNGVKNVPCKSCLRVHLH